MRAHSWRAMMHQWLRRPYPGTIRYGRRTLILVHGGAVWIILGWAIQGAPMERFSHPGPGGVLQFLDSPYWGLMWVAGGIAAIINAIMRQFWHGRDVVGFLGLITPSSAWLLCYIWSCIAYVVSGGTLGNSRAAVGALIWYLVTAFVFIVSGWPDPDDPDVRGRRPGGGRQE